VDDVKNTDMEDDISDIDLEDLNKIIDMGINTNPVASGSGASGSASNQSSRQCAPKPPRQSVNTTRQSYSKAIPFGHINVTTVPTG
jgi:hypothetical protein